MTCQVGTPAYVDSSKREIKVSGKLKKRN